MYLESLYNMIIGIVWEEGNLSDLILIENIEE